MVSSSIVNVSTPKLSFSNNRTAYPAAGDGHRYVDVTATINFQATRDGDVPNRMKILNKLTISVQSHSIEPS